MLLLKFDPNNIEKCQSVTDVFNMFGIAIKDGDPQDLQITDEEVFGKRAYYANMILDAKITNRIMDHLNTIGEKIETYAGEKMTPEAIQWHNVAPLHGGFRYNEIIKTIGKADENILYILTPKDPYYQDDPKTIAKRIKKEKKNSDS